MHGWLVIHNHFFANTVDISHKSSTSEMGVLQEFPILWKGAPERFFLAAGVVGLPTSVTELQQFPCSPLEAFLGLQPVALSVQQKGEERLAGKLLLFSRGFLGQLKLSCSLPTLENGGECMWEEWLL